MPPESGGSPTNQKTFVRLDGGTPRNWRRAPPLFEAYGERGEKEGRRLEMRGTYLLEMSYKRMPLAMILELKWGDLDNNKRLLPYRSFYLAPNPIPPPRPAFFPFFLAARLAFRLPAIAGTISASPAPSSGPPTPIPACFDILLIIVLIF